MLSEGSNEITRVKELYKLWGWVMHTLKGRELWVYKVSEGRFRVWFISVFSTMSSSAICTVDVHMTVWCSFGCPAFECLYHIWGVPGHMSLGNRAHLPGEKMEVQEVYCSPLQQLWTRPMQSTSLIRGICLGFESRGCHTKKPGLRSLWGQWWLQ